MTNRQVFLVLLTAAVCTLLTRLAPFLLFGGRRQLPPAVRYLGNVLPAAIMAVLVVYCLRGMTFSAAAGWMPNVLGAVVTAALHLWRKNTLISIAGGTVCYMVLVQIIFS